VIPTTQLENAADLAQGFSAWADSYDHQQNPLLMLEERYLSRLFSGIQGRDVLDVGCGTGRWLTRISQLNPRSLHGVDLSAEMLSIATAKNISHARLSKASCNDLPVEDESVDVLLASFVLSYLDDLEGAAREFARVARPGCDFFLSDMHPDTAARLDWQRSFRADGIKVKLKTARRGIQEVLTSLKSAGFLERTVLEPTFGEAERDIFATRNKLENFSQAEGLPAIYLIHLSKPNVAVSGLQKQRTSNKKRLLSGAQLTLGPHEQTAASVTIGTEEIETVMSQSPAIVNSRTSQIDLTGYILLPGLINAHDHLEFSLFPRLGKGPYKNSTQWARDIHESNADVIALHQKISKQTRLWWGGIHNLLNGVTTVCHHNQIDPLLLSKDFPVRVVSRVAWEHSLSFGVDIRSAHGSAGENEPFIVHACEGVDEQSQQELLRLDGLGVLDEHTVIVHGLALEVEGARLLNQRGSSLIICPSSNDFLFRTVPSPEVLASVTRVALGSDSPLTAAGGMLDEIRFAARTLAMRSEHLYSLVTDSSAMILRLNDGEGFIRPGARADLIAVRDKGKDPAEMLSSLCIDDIELVLVSGQIQMAAESVFKFLSSEDRNGLEPLSIDGNIRWLRAPIENLLREAEDILGKGEVRLGGKALCRPRFYTQN